MTSFPDNVSSSATMLVRERFKTFHSVVVFLVSVLSLWGEIVCAEGPIPDPIAKGPLSVDIDDFVRMPETGGGFTGQTRINFLREEPGGARRLFVNDLNGFLYTVDKTTKEVSTFLDFQLQYPDLKTAPGLASGLVTFGFHPQFAANGKFYTVHAEHLEGRTVSVSTPPYNPPLGTAVQHSVLTEWTTDDPSAPVFVGTRREVMRVGTHGWWHPMGDLGFRPGAQPGDEDYGVLYISIGDGQSFHHGFGENTQRLDSYLGKILRIDPDPTGQLALSANGQYSVPASNPFALDGESATLDEIYSYGFRNPHRISWDPVTDTLFAADIGEHAIEEVNIIEPGRNYGWPEREGTFVLGGDPLPTDDPSLGFTYPVAQFDHDEGTATGFTAVAGGFVYRGKAIPRLEGNFVFGEIASGRIFYTDVQELIAVDDGDPNTTATIRELQLVRNGAERELIDLVEQAVGDPNLERTDLRLAVDDEGELFITTKQDGYVRRLVTHLMAGDADMDFDFDERDLVQVLIASKYLSGRSATWGEGDWNGAPGGMLGAPPVGDNVFNQYDIVASQVSGVFRTGAYAATARIDIADNGQVYVGYDASTGEVWVEPPADVELASIGIDSTDGIFTDQAARNLDGSFDIDSDTTIFKATFGGSFGSLSFGAVARPGLTEEFVRHDLEIFGALSGSGALENVRLMYVPEPATLGLVFFAYVVAWGTARRRVTKNVT